MLDRLFEEFVNKHDFGGTYRSLDRNFLSMNGFESKSVGEVILHCRKNFSKDIVKDLENFNRDWKLTVLQFKAFISKKKEETSIQSNIEELITAGEIGRIGRLEKRSTISSGKGIRDQIDSSNQPRDYTMHVGSGMMDQIQQAQTHYHTYTTSASTGTGAKSVKDKLADYWSATGHTAWSKPPRR